MAESIKIRQALAPIECCTHCPGRTHMDDIIAQALKETSSPTETHINKTCGACEFVVFAVRLRPTVSLTISHTNCIFMTS